MGEGWSLGAGMIGGSGDINASGTTDSLEIDIPGSDDAHLDDLSALDAQVDISGSGNVSLRATTSFDASISGWGDISYAGNPRHLIEEVSGSGTVGAR